MRILVTGTNGQLGTEFAEVARAAGDDLTLCSHAQLDVTDRDAVRRTLTDAAPDVVLHAGTWTNVDGCETDPARAYTVNALGTRHLAEAARFCGARLIYVSTDFVFDGRGGGAHGGEPYTEWDTPAPVSHYGRSKLGGEQEAVAMLGPAATIVRTSWVVGRHGHNFLKTMLRLANPDVSPTVVDDQRGCPTFTADLAVTLRELTRRELPGVFHVSNVGPVTWCGFAKAIFEAAGHDPERVRPVSTAEYMAGRAAVTAPRPAFSVLEHLALQGVGITMAPWEPSLAAAVDALRT